MSIDREDFIEGYIEAALWSTPNMDAKEARFLDKDYNSENLAPELKEHVEKECAQFIEQNEDLLEQYMHALGVEASYAGHDFWLTRNRHGAGFWDKTYDDTTIGERLTEAAHNFKEEDWYVSDDNEVTCTEAYQKPVLSQETELPTKDSSSHDIEM
jgi:hypothetical protein